MIDLTRGLLIGVGAYGALLLVLGVLGRRARRADTLSDFYLAGRSIGLLVLLLTLFATQYSGNSMSGFPGQTYRRGLAYFMSVPFMVAIVAGYTLYAPRLFRRSRHRGYVTPTDFVTDRFGNAWLSGLSALIFALTLFNFLLAQLMAMGHAFAGLTDGTIPYAAGVIGGGAVILIYELLGGMRAVAWTDAIQGLLLITGLVLVLALLIGEVGGPATLIAQVGEIAPEKVQAPDLKTCMVWLSNLLLLGLGAPLYPQAIQRIYASRGLTTLRRALSVMALLPLFAITVVVLIGLAGIVLFPGLEGPDADQITFKVLAHLAQSQPWAAVPVIVVLLAILAAIMSTADSSLLSLSSIFSKDWIARQRGLDRVAAEGLTRVGAWFSVAAMAILVFIALRPLATLWGLLVIKFEILIQLSPAFVFGTRHERGEDGAFEAPEILAGLVTGLAVALGLHASGVGPVGGLHPGVLGLVANYGVALLGRGARRRRAARTAGTGR